MTTDHREADETLELVRAITPRLADKDRVVPDHRAGTQAENPMSNDPSWVVWSEEHGAWWAPGEMGYTSSLHNAGRYSEEAARMIENRANRYPLRLHILKRDYNFDPVHDDPNYPRRKLTMNELQETVETLIELDEPEAILPTLRRAAERQKGVRWRQLAAVLGEAETKLDQRRQRQARRTGLHQAG